MQFEMENISKHRFLIGITINVIFVVVEIYYAFMSNSVSLLADAVHNLSDVIGLGLVWFGYVVAKRQATYKFTYGFKNVTIIAAFINSLILIIAVGNLMWESSMRLLSPPEVKPMMVIVVAAAGVVVNGVTALLFLQGKEKDIGILSVYLNFALDVMLSIAVVVGGILVLWQNWLLADPILGLIIGGTVIVSLWKLFKESISLFFNAVPKDIGIKKIIAELKNTPGIISYHDLHIWALSTTENALSIHVVTSKEAYNPDMITKLSAMFKEKYNIQHCTIQLELENENKNSNIQRKCENRKSIPYFNLFSLP